MHPDHGVDLRDVLSTDEEEALSMLREAVAGLRGRPGAFDAVALEETLRGAGAHQEAESGGGGARCFTFRGARFSLFVRAEGAGGVEVNFTRAQQEDARDGASARSAGRLRS
jgi:hypothetical protein